MARQNADARAVALDALASLLGADRKLREDIALALRDPHASFGKYRKLLEIDEPVTDLAWMILLRGLRARSLLNIIDWREFPGEAAAMLERQWRTRGRQPKRAWAWVTPEMDNGKTKLADFLERSAREMNGHGVAPAWLDAGSDDDFAIVILPKQALGKAKATRLASDAGYAMGITFAKRPRPKRLFRPIGLPQPKTTPLLGPSPLWKKVRVGVLPAEQLPDPERALVTGNTLYGKGERFVTHARVLGWSRNENPRSLATPPSFNHLVLTDRRVVFATYETKMQSISENTVPLDHVEKKELSYFSSEHRKGIGVLKIADWTGTRVRGKWKITIGWRWLICDDALAETFQAIVRQTPRARLPN
jgi:hypothetical protein